jgi:cell division protein FtsI (penicillin-binding protein 3)
LPMLASVFDKGRHGGTARSIDVPGYRAGGKTGTSYKLAPAGKGYSDDLYLSSFAGLAPIDAPRIAVVVLIDEPSGEEHYGSLVAGPAFARVASDTLRYLGVPEDPAPVTEEEPSADPAPAEPVPPIASDADLEAPPVPGGIPLPSFEGMSIPQVLAAAREACTEVRISGSGRAVDQAPAPGRLDAPARCRITFATGDR